MVHQLHAARSRAVVLGVGLLVAAVGFSLLSSETVSSAVTVQGTLNSNFQPAYDILVRPPGTETALEKSDRLVNDDFLSNLYGGITVGQWQKILHLPGVSVAAPIENVGYFLLATELTVNLKPVVGSSGQQLFRVVPSFVVHGGLASIPISDDYLYYSNDQWVARAGNRPRDWLSPVCQSRCRRAFNRCIQG